MRHLLAVLCCLAMAGNAFAYEVTATGSGSTPDEAVQSALRAAVERATGAYIYSESKVKDAALISDVILSVSKSLVDRYSVVSSNFSDGLHHATIKADIKPSDIKPVLASHKLPTLDESLNNYHLVTGRMNRLFQASEILKRFNSKPASAAYNIDFVSYEILEIGIDTVKLRIKYNISHNRFFWDEFFDFMNLIVESTLPKGTDISSSREVWSGGAVCLGFTDNYHCDNPVVIDKALVNIVRKARTAKVVMSVGNKWKLSTDFFDLYMATLRKEARIPEKIPHGGLFKEVDVEVSADVVKNMHLVKVALSP